MSDEQLDRADRLVSLYSLMSSAEGQLSGYLRLAVDEVRRLRRLIPPLVDTARDWGYYQDGSTQEVDALRTVIELLDKAGVHMLGVNDPEPVER